MNPSEILEIIKAFFEAMKQLLVALGVMKEAEAEEEE